MSKTQEIEDTASLSPGPAPADASSSQPITPTINKFKKILLITGLAVLLIAGALFYLHARDTHQQLTSVKQVCSEQILSNASKAINAYDKARLGELATQVRGTKRYDSDVNCVFIVERYAIMQANIPDAKKYYTIYKQLYATQRVSKNLTTPVYTPDEIANIIKFLDEKAAFVKQETAKEEADKSVLDSGGDQALTEQKR